MIFIFISSFKLAHKINKIAFQSKANQPHVCIYDLDLDWWPWYSTLTWIF